MELEAAWEDAVARYPYLAPAASYKTRLLYSFYNAVMPDLLPVRNLVELGIYKGGSLVLWREALGCRVIGVDLDPPAPTVPAIQRYLTESGANDSVVLSWRTNQ